MFVPGDYPETRMGEGGAQTPPASVSPPPALELPLEGWVGKAAEVFSGGGRTLLGTVRRALNAKLRRLREHRSHLS